MRTHDAASSFYAHWVRLRRENPGIDTIVFIFRWKGVFDQSKMNHIWLFLLWKAKGAKKLIWFHPYTRSSMSYHVFALYSIILVSVDPFFFSFHCHVCLCAMTVRSTLSILFLHQSQSIDVAFVDSSFFSSPSIARFSRSVFLFLLPARLYCNNSSVVPSKLRVIL